MPAAPGRVAEGCHFSLKIPRTPSDKRPSPVPVAANAAINRTRPSAFHASQPGDLPISKPTPRCAADTLPARLPAP